MKIIHTNNRSKNRLIEQANVIGVQLDAWKRDALDAWDNHEITLTDVQEITQALEGGAREISRASAYRRLAEWREQRRTAQA